MSKAKAPKKKAVRDWIAIRNEYASTDISTRALAEKYGQSAKSGLKSGTSSTAKSRQKRRKKRRKS